MAMDMDPKLLCSSLSLMLVKTIKALCEINLKYDQKLEITGSLHVRSDGERVLTCLVDETTIKGQQDATKSAEIAPMALHNMGYPFSGLQLPTSISQLQPMATLLSQIQTGVPHLHHQVMGNERDNSLHSPSQGSHELPQMSVATAIVHPERHVKAHENPRSASLHPIAVHHMQHQPMQVDAMSTEAAVQAELHQAMVSLRRQSSSSGSGSSASSQGETSASTSAKMPNRTVPTASKMLDGCQVSLSSNSNMAAAAAANAVAAAAAAQNHVRLPNIQTLTQCLPKYPHVKMESATSSQAAAITESLNAVANSLNAAKSDAGTLSSPSPLTSPMATATSSSMPMTFPVDPLASVKVEVQQQLDAEGNLVHKKKFQCMFCGIFLSTKCYLKNHINAMHTRARVYPCELCERYFYSAGALRIHKLRNHWQGSKKHKCVHCSETFLLPIELRKHILKKHLGSPEALLMEGNNPSLNALMLKASTEQPQVTASEAARAAASLAMAAGISEPLSLVTSHVQVAPQNLSRGTPVSSDSPASLDDSQLSGSHGSTPAMDSHADIMLSTSVVAGGSLGNGRGRHEVISPHDDGMHE
ncbi:hypothetical protein CAPTEDRAFT_187457 [Capitella teleta]|uniref:C2H2-type domain-containing protein n=1 Tax=Capitella teleta TaxID=283909 RepID=R7VEQ2_CAPTE|nr:hypothetical protein CAPTEDRAFT_187457 [Capitella teleta]|eukprot:ELU17318.1 hypothetical protein CAPTEDRAFT_187457 [Capitella teleta]